MSDSERVHENIGNRKLKEIYRKGMLEDETPDLPVSFEDVREAGGTVTDVHGDPWTVDSDGIVASNGRAHVGRRGDVRAEQGLLEVANRPADAPRRRRT